MDFSGSPSRLFVNMLSQVWGRLVSNVGVRLLRLPLLLTALGPDDYGRWLVLVSLSSWLAIPNNASASVAGGSMAMSSGGGDLTATRKTYSDLVVFNSILFAGLAVLVCIASALLPLHSWLGVPVDRGGECRRALGVLGLAVLLAGAAEVFGARLRASGKSHLWAVWMGLSAWLELAVLFVVLRYTRRFDMVAGALLFVTVLFTIALYLSSRRVLREVRFDVSCVSFDGLAAIFRGSLYFQAFPLGHSVLLQGQLLVVQWLMGPASVAVYSTARTLVRVISQGLETVNHSVWPEMSLLFGSNRNMDRIAALHRSSVVFSMGISIVSVTIFLLFGPGLYALASGKMLAADRVLLSCFLFPIPFNALWYTSSVVQLACNRHEGVASRYILSALAALSAGILMTKSMGLMGAALATTVSDLLMIPYVLRRSIAITGDDFRGIWTRAMKDISEFSGRFTS